MADDILIPEVVTHAPATMRTMRRPNVDNLTAKRMRMTAKEIAAVENAIENARHRVREAMLAESTVFQDGIDRLVLALHAAEQENARLREVGLSGAERQRREDSDG